MYTFIQEIITTTPQKHVNVIHQSNNDEDHDSIPLQIQEKPVVVKKIIESPAIQPPVIEMQYSKKKEKEKDFLQQNEIEQISSDSDEEKEEEKKEIKKAKHKEVDTKTKLVMPSKPITEDNGLKVLQEFINKFINPLTTMEEKVNMAIKSYYYLALYLRKFLFCR